MLLKSGFFHECKKQTEWTGGVISTQGDALRYCSKAFSLQLTTLGRACADGVAPYQFQLFLPVPFTH
jgi:hypothetical protein